MRGVIQFQPKPPLPSIVSIARSRHVAVTAILATGLYRTPILIFSKRLISNFDAQKCTTHIVGWFPLPTPVLQSCWTSCARSSRISLEAPGSSSTNVCSLRLFISLRSCRRSHFHVRPYRHLSFCSFMTSRERTHTVVVQPWPDWHVDWTTVSHKSCHYLQKLSSNCANYLLQ